MTDVYTVNWIGDVIPLGAMRFEISAEYPEISFISSDIPLQGYDTDLYIIRDTDITLVPEILSQAYTPPCLIWGSSTHVYEAALTAGCADAMVLPAGRREFAYRIKRNIRNRMIDFGSGSVRFTRKHILGDRGLVSITEREYRLLLLFVNIEGSVCPKETIAEYIGVKQSESSRVVDVYISKLRKKIGAVLPAHSTCNPIISVRGKGYRTSTWVVDNL